MTTCNYTARQIGPRVYTRPIEESDWQSLQAIYGDFKDFPLTDEQAQQLANVWARNMRECVWPFTESTHQQSCTLFCLNSNDTAIGLMRTNNIGFKVETLLTIIHPDYKNQGYFNEAVNMLNHLAWEHWNCEAIVAELRTDIATRQYIRGSLEVESTRLSEGLKAIEHRKTTLTRAGWNAYKASSSYVEPVYTLHPYWPPEE